MKLADTIFLACFSFLAEGCKLLHMAITFIRNSNFLPRIDFIFRYASMFYIGIWMLDNSWLLLLFTLWCLTQSANEIRNIWVFFLVHAIDVVQKVWLSTAFLSSHHHLRAQPRSIFCPTPKKSIIKKHYTNLLIPLCALSAGNTRARVQRRRADHFFFRRVTCKKKVFHKTQFAVRYFAHGTPASYGRVTSDTEPIN